MLFVGALDSFVTSLIYVRVFDCDPVFGVP